jgi:hypothetical protein
VKRREIIKRIASEARSQGVEWRFCREGANHSIFLLDGMVIPVPRHNDVSEIVSVGIFRECQAVLGKGWWRT